MAHLARDPTLRRVVDFLQLIAPTRLAGSWDNVGLIAQSPVPRTGRGVFLAVDLTTDVAEEALALPDVNTAIIYHPVIFSPVRSLTLAQPLQRSILSLVAAGISIYCPHTCLDAIDGGINDWIVAGLQHAWEKEPLLDETLYQAVREGTKAQPIEPIPNARTETEGMGRVFSLDQPVPIRTLIARAKEHFAIDAVHVALGQDVSDDTPMRRVAVCAGSGGSVLRQAKDADVWVTGELGHHEVLAAVAQGISVILTNHSNTERRFFRSLFAPLLREQLPELTVHVSEKDCDPLHTE
ncbi:hypothetical protein GLX27_001027 [Malassezia furfur]|uniref:Uncharacterized protein n=1 Tax=Malassezia furfur TaxID=55194 RepID=A0ABY8ELF0_MALFU|nr:hypothetical protein CBS14141_001308 [Malassezia furfur]WFD46392.1 hypothetical protein GLX27_001027 [Malassezia furfur]